MEGQPITFETAKIAKEKGFNIPLYTSYINGIFHENEPEPNGYDGWDIPDKENWNKKDWVFTKEGDSCFGCRLDNIKYFEACSAPTQSLLEKWLLEVKHINIELTFDDGQWFIYTGEFLYPDSSVEFVDAIACDSFEEAIIKKPLAREKGLQEALKLI